MRILLVRHGETAWSPEARLQGLTDVPLSAEGRAQAEAVRVALREERLQALYASPLSRAWDTALIIARGRSPALEARRDERLREIGLGTWEGLTLEEARRRDPAAVEEWLRDPRTAAPEGESKEQADARLSAFARELAGRTEDTVAVVGHLLAFQGLICALMGVAPASRWPYHLYTGSLSELRLDDRGASLVYLNRVHHLSAAGLDTDSLRNR
jgi:broad specificity phosphatase PhoE